MKYLVFLALFIVVQSRPASDYVEDTTNCQGLRVRGEYHKKEVLQDNIDRPYLLTVDYGTNTLYYSESIAKEEDVFKSSYINLNTKQGGTIEEVNNGFAQTVDQKTHDAYIGGSDGLYKFNHTTKTVEPIGRRGVDVWTVYYKDELYFSVFPTQFLYTYANSEFTRFKDLEDTKVDHLVIDNEDTIFFTNDTGLYSQQKGTKEAVFYIGGAAIRGLTTDVKGKPYACINDGLYEINKKETKIEKIATIFDAFGLAFDNENNIVYADAKQIVRLTPSKEEDCEELENKDESPES